MRTKRPLRASKERAPRLDAERDVKGFPFAHSHARDITPRRPRGLSALFLSFSVLSAILISRAHVRNLALSSRSETGLCTERAGYAY